MRRQDSAGLTLLEVLIAVSVLAILSALTLPAMGQRADRQRLVTVAETLAADLNEARFEASKHAGGIGLSAQAGPQWCWSLAVGQAPAAACACSPDQGCGLKQVKATSHPGIVMQTGQAVQMTPDGSASISTQNSTHTTIHTTPHTTPHTTTVALFESRRGEQLRVDLLAVGRSRICAPHTVQAHPLSRYPRC